MHFRQVIVQRDETTSIPVLVGDWEVPLLQQKYGGDERVTIGELKEFKGREWPADPRSEMQRLNQLYGRTSAADNAPTFAEQVFGVGAQGVKVLGAAIAEARKAAPKGRSKGADLVGSAASA